MIKIPIPGLPQPNFVTIVPPHLNGGAFGPPEAVITEPVAIPFAGYGFAGRRTLHRPADGKHTWHDVVNFTLGGRASLELLGEFPKVEKGETACGRMQLLGPADRFHIEIPTTTNLEIVPALGGISFNAKQDAGSVVIASDAKCRAVSLDSRFFQSGDCGLDVQILGTVDTLRMSGPREEGPIPMGSWGIHVPRNVTAGQISVEVEMAQGGLCSLAIILDGSEGPIPDTRLIVRGPVGPHAWGIIALSRRQVRSIEGAITVTSLRDSERTSAAVVIEVPSGNPNYMHTPDVPAQVRARARQLMSDGLPALTA